MKLTPRLIIQAAVAIAALARLFAAAQASNMPTQPSRKAPVVPIKRSKP